MPPYSPSTDSPSHGHVKPEKLEDDTTPSGFTKGMRNFVRRDIRASIQKARKGKRRPARESRKNRLRALFMTFYQRIILEAILHRKPLPRSKDGRHIPLNPTNSGPSGLIDERSGNPYVSNYIRSSRYTIWSFIPAQLVFQFSKLGNFYFLVIGVVQIIPGLSTVGRWTTIAPLALFVLFSMLKEGYDDWRRYGLDKVENRDIAWVMTHGVRENSENRPKDFSGKGWKDGRPIDDGKSQKHDDSVAKYGDGHWIPVQWQHVQVGDVVRLRRDDGIPADIALLHATGPNGIAYIDTMALDGETNLKSKQACPLFTERCCTMKGLMSTKAVVVSEDPNLDLYNYDGKVLADDEELPLTQNNIVYRGSTLRNTTMAIGIVINSGEECKIRLNANKNNRAKKPAMQSIINRMVLFQIFGVLLLSGGLTIGYFLWENPTENNSFYLVEKDGLVQWDASVPWAQIFIGYVIMYNTLIPLSLYISLEIVKLGQFFLMQDPEMYDPVTDTPMVANTTTILENLGQVSYVFSDKTGTLTENIMRFRKMSVAGVACLHDMDLQKDDELKEQKIEASQRDRKGKTKALTPVATHATIQEGNCEELDEELSRGRPTLRPTLSRMSTNNSLTRWKSSARPHDEPEMKTEELLDYIRQKPNSAFSRKVKHFLLCIALCHTCLPETQEDGELGFQAASPDELALVEAARDLGYLVIDRPSNTITLQITREDGSLQTETYQVLDVVEFSSKRKRMSIIVRMPDGRICVLCKGADNVIIERLSQCQLAEKTVTDVGRKAGHRKTFEQDRAFQRQGSPRSSPRNSIGVDRNDLWKTSIARRSNEIKSLSRSEDVTQWLSRRQTEDLASPRGSMEGIRTPRQQSRSRLAPSPHRPVTVDFRVDESVATNEGAIFQRCFEHINHFASEGLRTLLYGYRYIDEDDYVKWKDIYHRAETSLVDRQVRIEEASELIEQKFELAGATAIEDKLQDGVPETIDKLRRASIKVWMLTGDKRETAINIGHSARLCKAFSEIYILDSTLDNLRQRMMEALNAVGCGTVPHSVLVIDGQTLAVVDNDEDLAMLFYDLAIQVDSVICCRASPAQKANLVKSIRRYVPKTMTLAIGDGANDIGMILEAHVGIGISGREGLQAARISDYSIAQFRFLQKLLFVHGRWNYLRTGKYILATFWKEIIFYIVQAHFQRYNAYTGTSLYENWSLTVFNVLFTSLPVIFLGIFEKDLSQDTLLAVPELYTFGQKNQGFNYLQYLGWATMAAINSCLIFYPAWAVYNARLFNDETSLYSMGVACFTVAVFFINIKCL